MKNLVKKLESEAGLNNDQARMAVGIFRDYLIGCEDDPDLAEAMKIKASHVAKTARSQAEIVVEKVGNVITNAGNKAGDKADEVLDKARKKLKVVVDKLSDYLAD